MDHRLVGTAVPRKEAVSKVTGAADYVDDIVLPGMLHGVTVRSSIPRGRIRNVAFGADVPWDEIFVVAAKDIPGKNIVSLISEDQPFLAQETINHQQEPILLLAHRSKEVVQKARERITIEY